MGVGVASEWARSGIRGIDGGPVLPAKSPTKTAWCHEVYGLVLPMPSTSVLAGMRGEISASKPGDTLGPCCSEWLTGVHKWLRRMVRRFQAGDGRVTGNWARAADEWELRLKRVRKGAELRELMSIIRKGGPLPFDKIPPTPIRRFSNHPNLMQKPTEVWATVSEQLREGAVIPFDVKGAYLLNGNKKMGGTLPVCMFSSNWVQKAGTSKVRITCNGRPLKPFFKPEVVACDLDTNDSMRHLWQEGDLFVSFDQHSSFYHYLYLPDHTKYVGASFHCDEFPAGVGLSLANRYPEAVLPLRVSNDGAEGCNGPQSWRADAIRNGSFRIVLVYAGMMMGVSPSVAMLGKVMQPLMDSWLSCTVGSGELVEQSRGGIYVDDSIFAVSGRSLENACELSLRLAVEHVILGFVLNLKPGKSCLVPMPHQVFCGTTLDVRRGCWFTLTERRVLKLTAALVHLRSVTRVGYAVAVLDIAKVVGLIWSIHVVAHRAVSIMCRGMIRVLAIHLGKPELCEERNMDRLRVLLRVAWKGSGTWTAAPDDELTFWLDTDFASLRSRMRHDAVNADIKAWVARPDGTVASDIRVFAADTSATGSGGGEFVRHGCLWRMKPDTKVFVRLREDELADSSALRECNGVDRLDVAAIPPGVTKAVVVCDAQASVHVLERGSSIPKLHEVSVRVFKRQLRWGRILFYCWRSRNDRIIEYCDDASRLQDRHAFQTPPALFWGANDIARTVYGQGFQLDAMADMHNVMPPDTVFKLPHFSRWLAPYTSGVDALAQTWHGVVAWANPPFALAERIICLLRQQRATAAVVLPVGARRRWSPWAKMGAPGVLKVWTFDPTEPQFRMRGGLRPQPYRSGFAVVFFDFRSKGELRQPWSTLEGARSMRLRSERMQAEVSLAKRPPVATTFAILE